MVAGLVAAVVLAAVGSVRSDLAIEGFARAPSGCETEITFDRAGVFVLFIETSSRLPDGGRCGPVGVVDARADAGLQLQVTLVDPTDSTTLRLGRVEAIGYDTEPFRGRSFRQVSIERPVSVIAIVEGPPESSLVLAIGRDPSGFSTVPLIAALIAGVAGVLGGFTVFVAGLIVRFGGTPPPLRGPESGAPLPPPMPPPVR